MVPEWLYTTQYLAIDTETLGLSVQNGDRPFCVSFTSFEGEDFYVRFNVNPFTREVLYEENPTEFDAIRELVRSRQENGLPFVFHNAKFDIGMLQAALLWPLLRGAERTIGVLDTIILAHLANSSRFTYGLKPLTKQLFGIGVEDEVELQKATVKARHQARKKGWKIAEEVKADYWLAPDEVCRKYAVADTQRTMRLFKSLMHLFDCTEGPYASFRELSRIEHEIMFVTLEMNNQGVALSPSKINELEGYYQSFIERGKHEMESLGFGDLNPRSSKQKIEAFYGTLGFDAMRRKRKQADGSKKSTVSVDKKIMEVLSERSPLAKCLLEISEAQHQLNSFIKPFRELGLERGNELVLYPNFNSVGQVTDRFSCSKPNLQNITSASSPFRRSSVEFKTRECFITRKGCWWLLADYSQVEIWLAGYLSRDVVIMGVLESGKSLHDLTCDKVFGGLPDFQENRAKYRKLSKILTFSIFYGSGPKALSELLNVTYEEAKVYYSTFWRTYPGLKAYAERLSAQTQEQGYVQNVFGRPYFVPKDHSYKALNYMVQGTAAGIMKGALLGVSKLCKTLYPELSILMTIHDEIVLEGPVEAFKEKGPEIVKKVLEAMRGNFHELLGMKAPFDLEVSFVTENWGNKIKYTLDK